MFELAKMQALQLRYVARLLSGFKEAIDCLEGVICAICSGQIPDHRCGITEFKRGDEPGEESLLDIKFYRVDNVPAAICANQIRPCVTQLRRRKSAK